MREFQLGDKVSFKYDLDDNRVLGIITEDLGGNEPYPLKVQSIDPKAIGWSTYDALYYNRQGAWYGGERELVLIEPSLNTNKDFYIEPKIPSKLEKILDLIDEQGIDQVTFNSHTFNEEYQLPCDDKDYVTFHKRDIGVISIPDKLLVCDYLTTETPIYKGWFMTINYHS